MVLLLVAVPRWWSGSLATVPDSARLMLLIPASGDEYNDDDDGATVQNPRATEVVRIVNNSLRQQVLCRPQYFIVHVDPLSVHAATHNRQHVKAYAFKNK